MDLIRARGLAWQGVVKVYDLDLAFGDEEENDFTLTVPLQFAEDVGGSFIEPGDFVFFAGTEWGGVVDSRSYDNTGDYAVLAYKGRTWHGILSHSVLKPDPGKDYLTVSGSVKSIIASLISRQGLSDVFEAADGGGEVSSYSFDRYTDMYSGLRKMLAGSGLRLEVTKGRGKCALSASPARDLSRGVDDNFLRFTMGQNTRPVNHLVCLGSGDLKDRLVVDLYADVDGAVSKTQTLFGVDEVAETYDSNNEEDPAKLAEDGTDRLLGYHQDAKSIDAEIPGELDARVGDMVTASSVNMPFSVSAEVSSVTVEASNNSDPDVSYKIGSLRVKGM